MDDIGVLGVIGDKATAADLEKKLKEPGVNGKIRAGMRLALEKIQARAEKAEKSNPPSTRDSR